MGKKRKAGEGTLRLRKDGRWEGRIVVDYDENGKPKTKNITAKTKAECLKKLEALKEKCGIVTGRARPDMPFGDWLDLWYKTYSKPNIRITTQLSYENRIYLHIIPSIGKIPLNKLTQSDHLPHGTAESGRGKADRRQSRRRLQAAAEKSAGNAGAHPR